ncbi:MAG: hypothetical protein WA208_21590 [Thermoanaerobaculia bacterium]
MNRYFIAAVLSMLPVAAYPCTRLTPIDPAEMVRFADLIVVARAVGYDRPPANPNIHTTGAPDSVVRFEVDEWVKGKGPISVSLNGYLSAADDFNDRDVPYTFVRRGGRSGSCFANTYREGARFLLLLKLHQGAYTADWYALGPTNEQLHDGEDAWLVWVRAQAGAGTSPN